MNLKSRWGELNYKFDHTGLGGHDVISTPELKELLKLTEEMDRVMVDAECLPVAFYFRQIAAQVDRMIDNRKLWN